MGGVRRKPHQIRARVGEGPFRQWLSRRRNGPARVDFTALGVNFHRWFSDLPEVFLPFLHSLDKIPLTAEKIPRIGSLLNGPIYATRGGWKKLLKKKRTIYSRYRLTICEHCLLPFAWFIREEEAEEKLALLCSPHPCPRCGAASDPILGRIRKKKLHNHLIVAVVLLVSGFFIVQKLYSIAVSAGWRSEWFFSSLLAIIAVASGIWGGSFLSASRADLNRDLKGRKRRASNARGNSDVVPYSDFATRLGAKAPVFPDPPKWEWTRAEAIQGKDGNSGPRYVFWGGLAGIFAAFAVLFSSLVYVEKTRATWEWKNLLTGDLESQQIALVYLWNSGEEETRTRILEWLRHERPTSEDAEVYLASIPDTGGNQKSLIARSILFHQRGLPGPIGLNLLRSDPEANSERILAALEKGEADAERLMRLWFLLGIRSPDKQFLSRLPPTPGVVAVLAQSGALSEECWKEVAARFLTESRDDRGIRLELVEAFLRHAPLDGIRDELARAINELAPWVVETVSLDTERFYHTALFQPRLAWVKGVLDVFSGLEFDLSEAVRAGDSLARLGPVVENELGRLDKRNMGSDYWAILRTMALVAPEEASLHCQRRLSAYLARRIGVRNPETLPFLEEDRIEIERLALVLKGVPMDRLWVSRCTGGLKIPDRNLREVWTGLLAKSEPEDLLSGFRDSLVTRDRTDDWEIEAYLETLRRSGEATAERIAAYLVQCEADEGRRLPPLLKFALLRYLRNEADPSILPELAALSNDETVLRRELHPTVLGKAGAGVGDASFESIHLGQFAAGIARHLADSQTLPEVYP